MNKDKIMELLVDKFLDGATTNAEEQQLYEYFAGNNVARRLRKYTPMFGWYAGGMKGQLPDIWDAACKCRKARTRWIRAAVSTAAAILLIAGVTVAYVQYRQTQRLYATYEGSYIVRNGKKITDIKSILPELKRIEHQARALDSRYKGISHMQPKEIFKLMDKENRRDNNGPTI